MNVTHAELGPDAQRLGKLIAHFGSNVERLLRVHREGIVDREYQLGRIGDSAIELFMSACVLRRLDAAPDRRRYPHARSDDDHSEIHHDLVVGRHYLLTADRRIRAHLAAVWDNDDASTTQTADLLL